MILRILLLAALSAIAQLIAILIFDPPAYRPLIYGRMTGHTIGMAIPAFVGGLVIAFVVKAFSRDKQNHLGVVVAGFAIVIFTALSIVGIVT